MFSDFSMIIMAGGHSHRMGQDKAALTLPDGRSFLRCQIDKGRALGIEDILISGGREAMEGAQVVPDNFPDSGPIGGLEACLAAAKHEKSLVVGVDTPLIPLETLEGLMLFAGECAKPIAVLRSPDGLQPLIGVYDRAVLPVIRSRLAAGQRKLLLMLEECGYAACENDGAGLTNINTPQDYAALCRSDL